MKNRAPGHADSWYSCNLGDAMLAGETLERIKTLFRTGCGKDAFPPGSAIFIRHESEGRLHCEVRVFFPPELAELAERFGATSCQKPSPESLGVLTGG